MIGKTRDVPDMGALMIGLAAGGVAAVGATGAGLAGAALLGASPLKALAPPPPLAVPLALAGGVLAGAATGLAAVAMSESGARDATQKG